MLKMLKYSQGAILEIFWKKWRVQDFKVINPLTC